MNGSQATQWRCRERPARALRALDSKPAESVVLVSFSTRLPAVVRDRLRVAARRLGLRRGESTAAALDLYMSGEGF
jgi:hypothetical protein